MNATTQADLLTALAELSGLYPDMRLGQLVEMLALLASDTMPSEPAQVEDASLLEATVAHVERRAQQLGIARSVLGQRPLAATRRELLEVLRQLQDRHADWRFGQVAAEVAAWCAVGLYDVEDEHLAVAARKHLGGEAA